MKSRAAILSTALAVSLCAAAALGAYGVAGASEPAPSSRTATAASAAKAAPLPGTVASSGEAIPRGGWLPPEAKSEQPEAAEWSSATPLELPRQHCADGLLKTGECGSRCSAKVLREWVQVTCARPSSMETFMGVRVLAGASGDVSLFDPPAPTTGDKRGARGFSLVFPVRRGDRRTIEIAEMLPMAWKSWTVEEGLGMVVSALWLPSAARPTVTVY